MSFRRNRFVYYLALAVVVSHLDFTSGQVKNSTPNCPSSYECANGTCIGHSQLCNGVDDCDTDETDITCRKGDNTCNINATCNGVCYRGVCLPCDPDCVSGCIQQLSYKCDSECKNRFFLNSNDVCQPQNCSQAEPCRNGGTCVDPSSWFATYQCNCSEGFKGDRCELAKTSCDSSPCLNGGTCTVLPTSGDFTCSCTRQFEGGQCQILKDPCSPDLYKFMPMYDGRRSNYWTTRSDQPVICDYDYRQPPYPDWVRFKHFSGSRLASQQVNVWKCGTQSSIWMNGTHPTGNTIVQRQLCASYGTSTVCDWTGTVSVKRCLEDKSSTVFYVYKLSNPPGCSVAYCVDGDDYQSCPIGQLWSKEYQYCYPNMTTATVPSVNPTFPPPTNSSSTPGTWSAWSEWTSCTKTCDYGLQFRTRVCLRLPCQGPGSNTRLCDTASCPENKTEKSEGISVTLTIKPSALTLSSTLANNTLLMVVGEESFLLETWRGHINHMCSENHTFCCGSTATSSKTQSQRVEFVASNNIWTASGFPRPSVNLSNDVELKFVAVVNSDANNVICGASTSSLSSTFIDPSVLEAAVIASSKQMQDETGLFVTRFMKSEGGETTTQSPLAAVSQGFPSWGAGIIVIVLCLILLAIFAVVIFIVCRRKHRTAEVKMKSAPVNGHEQRSNESEPSAQSRAVADDNRTRYEELPMNAADEKSASKNVDDLDINSAELLQTADRNFRGSQFEDIDLQY